MAGLNIRSNPNEVPDPHIKSDYYEVAARLIQALDEKREINRYGRHAEYNWLSTDRGAVLVFLPGLGEIIAMNKCLEVSRIYILFGLAFRITIKTFFISRITKPVSVKCENQYFGIFYPFIQALIARSRIRSSFHHCLVKPIIAKSFWPLISPRVH